MSRRPVLLPIVVVLLLAPAALRAQEAAPLDATEGRLVAAAADGKLLDFPLRHTDVLVEVSGAVARTTVTQIFANPFEEPIEAIYVFPLSERAAVTDMLIVVGERRIRAIVKPRGEAREIYEKAKSEGKTAGLLDQERPNLFTQSLANLLPREEVRVEIRTVETVVQEKGRYRFVFPMVVGPRYVPEGVKDKERITPPPVPEGMRTGHDIALSVALRAGLPVREIASPSHRILIAGDAPESRTVSLAPADTIPNKDFVLEWTLAGKEPEAAVLAHRTDAGGFFSLRIEPPESVEPDLVLPRELVFVLDCSGSMSGMPVETGRKVIRRCLERLAPDDVFRVLSFSMQAAALSPEPLPASPDAVGKALAFVDAMEGEGGTQMIAGIRAALAGEPADGRMRIVYFLTDGYIGNETEILAAVRELLGTARIFPLGVGSSVNRYLLEEMALAGRGAVRYVRFDAEPERIEAEVEAFYERTARPFLTDLEVDWHGIPVADVYPERLPDLFAGQGVEVVGRYTGAAQAEVVLRGLLGGRPWEKSVTVALPEREEANEVLASLWARARIGELDRQLGPDGDGPQKQAITDLAVEFHLASRFTSFVAVDERVVVDPNGEKRTVVQPLPIPEGTEFGGFFGAKAEIGIGGGSGGSFTGRGGRRSLRAAGGGVKTTGAVDLSLEWLKGHVGEAASTGDDGGDPAFGPAKQGLALLVFLGAGDTHKSGRYKVSVREGFRDLKAIQEPDGWFGPPEGPAAVANHAIATLAMAEIYGLTASPLFKTSAQRGADALAAGLDPDLAWRLGRSPAETVWVALALASASKAGLAVSAEAIAAVKARLDAPPVEGAATSLPPATDLSLGAAKAVALLLLGEDPASERIRAAVETFRKAPPVADPAKADPAAVWFGSLLLWRTGGEAWKEWTPTLKLLAVDTQRQGPDDLKGSWDPSGPGMAALGRIGASVLANLASQIYYRYFKTFGVR